MAIDGLHALLRLASISIEEGELVIVALAASNR